MIAHSMKLSFIVSLRRSVVVVAVLNLLPAVLANADVKSSKAKTAGRSVTRVETKNSRVVHPLVPALRYAKSSLNSIQAAKDYEATFSKRDIVNRRVHAHTTHIKYRAQPMSVYLKFKEPHAGREVIYVAGQNDGKLLAHETGIKSIIGTIALLPSSPQAMSESKHPITEIGMAKLVQGVINQWTKETKYGEVRVEYYPDATHTKLGKIKCRVIQTTHPRPRKQFKFHMTRLWIDRKTNLPVRVEQWGFPNGNDQNKPLLEEYTYRDVKINVGLKNIDFDVQNSNYNY